MLKYETGGYYGGGALINPIEVIRETEKCVYVIDYNGQPRRQMKENRYEQVHETWEAAHKFLMDAQQEKVDYLRKQLETANGRLGQIKGIKKPEAAC